MAGYLSDRLHTKVGFDTHVNAVAIADWSERSAQGFSSLCYITVGTSIGGGALLDGRPIMGAAHPEMGHIRVRRHPADGAFGGVCPYHGDCLDGLVSGRAIAARWKSSLSDLPADHEAHDIVAFYLAQLAHSLFSILSSEVVVFGGGVTSTRGLRDRIRRQAMKFEASCLPTSDQLRIEALGSLRYRRGDDARCCPRDRIEKRIFGVHGLGLSPFARPNQSCMMTTMIFDEAMLEYHSHGGTGLRYGGDTLATAPAKKLPM